MDWKELYQKRSMTAEEAVKHIHSHDRVVIGHAAAEPQQLMRTLAAHKDDYQDVELLHLVMLGSGATAAPDMEGHFRHNVIFAGGGTRKAIEEGRADFTPCFFYQVPALFDSALPVDVALIQVSKPDAHGFCSYGVSVDFTKAAAEKAKLVIAQVNDQMPSVHGDCHIHIRDLDCIVEYSEPILQLPPPAIGELEMTIGRYCADLVPDGGVLQLGIGAIPDAVCKCLTGKKDLALHSEMVSDGVVDLVESGVINNSRKTLHPGKSVIGFMMGTQKLYDWVNDNASVMMMPIDYVNDPTVIMRNDNMISINSCVQVDLTGQVCAESVGLRQLSGIGGQVDFVRGAQMSRGGKSIIAIASTAAGGKISKIVPLLDEGAAVTTSRTDVDYVVTEYGVAHLHGKSLAQRARALIEIAHPSFRPMLIETYEQRFHRAF